MQPIQRMIWTANHPPLYHLLAVPAVWLADGLHEPGIALFFLRALNAMSTAVTVVVSGPLAQELLPQHRYVALVSAAATAAMTTITFQAGFAYNDGLAAATGGLALLMVARTAMRGITSGRIWWITVWCVAAAATRPTGVVLTAVVSVAVLLLFLVRGQPPIRAFLAALVVGGLPALIIGWFYLRNVVLFGDPTASAALLERFGREPKPAMTTVCGMVDYLRSQWDQLFIQRRLGRASTYRVYFIRGLGKVLASGLVLYIICALARGRWIHPLRERDTRLLSRMIVWTALVAYSVLVIVATIGGLADGVGNHERYLMPVVPLLSILIGLGVVGFASWVPSPVVRPTAGATLAALGGGLFLVFGLKTHQATVAWFTQFQLATGHPSLLGFGASDVFGEMATAAIALCLVVAAAVVVFALVRRDVEAPPASTGSRTSGHSDRTSASHTGTAPDHQDPQATRGRHRRKAPSGGAERPAHHDHI